MPAAEADRPGKVFVGGLASDIDEAVLEKYFSHYGRLTEVIVKRDKNTHQTRGYAFITFENPYDADDAIKEMDKKEIHGRQIYVEQAVKPRHEIQNQRPPPRGGSFRGAPRGSRGGGGSGRGGGSRGGPRGRGGDGNMEMRSRSPIRQRSDRGRSDRDFSRQERGAPPPRRDGYDGPPRRDLINEFEHTQKLDEEKPWITPDLVLLVRQKDEMQEWANKCPSLMAEFRKFRNHVRMKIRKAKVEYEDPTGEKRDEEFKQRMLKKGLTPEEIEKRKNDLNRPETHHGGKKYEPPIMYPGNLATATTTLQVGGPTETLSVTHDPEAKQQKAKFVNLMSKQSKTVYESYQKKNISKGNWSEKQANPNQNVNQGWYSQSAPSTSQYSSTNVQQPVEYTQTQQAYSQVNTSYNWQSYTNQQQQWGSATGPQEYTWSSNYSYTTSDHNPKPNQNATTEETPQNPWQQAMADYWQKASETSSFGPPVETGGFTQTSVSQTMPYTNQQFASQTQSSAYQNLNTVSYAQTQSVNTVAHTQTQSFNTVTPTQTQNPQLSSSNSIADRLNQMAYGAQPVANPEVQGPVNDNVNLKDTAKKPPNSNSGKSNQVSSVKQFKPPVQYFKGVAKNKNKIQIHINQKFALGGESQAKKDSNTGTEKEEVETNVSESSVKENPWLQSIEEFWKNPPKILDSETSKQSSSATQSSSTKSHTQTHLNENQAKSNAQSGANQAKNEAQTQEINTKNEQKPESKSENNPLPETELKPVNENLLESQKEALQKVISNKPLKDKNWSEGQETVDIEELDFSTDNPHYFPHPATVSPYEDFTDNNSGGNTVNVYPYGQGGNEDFGGDRYGGMDRGMDRGPPQRSRDPPMSRGRDNYSPAPRDFSRGSGPDRMTRGSGRDFQQSSRYDPPQRDYSPPPREYQSSRDIAYERGPTSRDRLPSRDYGSPQNTRDYGGGMSRGGTSMYGGSRDTGIGGRDVYSGGRDRDQSRDYVNSRDFSSRGGSSRMGPSRGGPSRGGGDFDRGQPHEDSFRDSGRGGPPSRGPASRSFSSMSSQRDGGRPSQGMYESPNRGPPQRGAPSRGHPQRDDRDRGGYPGGQRRPSNMDSRGGPPMKRSRPSGPSSRGGMRR
ncbi:uncharacterized protein LOC133180907 [Saccostrea echinata]|uniref:uncharacterized protein LOC133180907 n=1 Tax=Saccostrea echinata TaxID=191078 RepID=UPI002A800CB4|nr:uncharacterized protein LOC133180907 [Saccostrea echinata]